MDLLGFEVEPASDFSKEYATKGYIDIKVSNITSSFLTIMMKLFILHLNVNELIKLPIKLLLMLMKVLIDLKLINILKMFLYRG